MADAIIETRDLKMTFKTRAGEVEAVKGIDLNVAKGESFGFLGPNGAGKTTTLRILATLLTATGGEAKVAGIDLRRQPDEVRKRIGFVGQSTGSDSGLSGRAELAYQGRFYGLDKATADQRATELLAAFELTDAANRKTKTYSGGMRRRLDVAMGIIHRPPILFLDEPTTGLDPQARARMWDEVKKLAKSGTTVFLTTHYLDEADALADRLLIIDHGRIVAEGTPGELKKTLRGDAVHLELVDGRIDDARRVLERLGATPDGGEGRTLVSRVENGNRALPGILSALDQEGIGVESVSVSRPSLDDVYLHYTGRDFAAEDRGET
jgi:ABC-2 type transport system ATP-binding protein